MGKISQFPKQKQALTPLDCVLEIMRHYHDWMAQAHNFDEWKSAADGVMAAAKVALPYTSPRADHDLERLKAEIMQFIRENQGETKT